MNRIATPQPAIDLPPVLPAITSDPAETRPGTVMPELLKELEFEFTGSTARTATMQDGVSLCSSTSCSCSSTTKPSQP
ncbi:MAG: hypothetical protein L0G87_13440 [Renibacterium salmoninarum]|jgi:hypothetical protein|nr:hypothetical protein [Renibacterium salmoninarum]